MGSAAQMRSAVGVSSNLARIATPPARITIFRMRFNLSEGPRDRDDKRPQGTSLSLRAVIFKGFA
jgi:hypothetical protein